MIYFLCNATPTTSPKKNVTTVLRVVILTLAYFINFGALTTYNTVAVLEVHLTNRLWFKAIESFTDK